MPHIAGLRKAAAGQEEGRRDHGEKDLRPPDGNEWGLKRGGEEAKRGFEPVLRWRKPVLGECCRRGMPEPFSGFCVRMPAKTGNGAHDESTALLVLRADLAGPREDHSVHARTIHSHTHIPPTLPPSSLRRLD